MTPMPITIDTIIINKQQPETRFAFSISSIIMGGFFIPFYWNHRVRRGGFPFQTSSPNP